MKTVPITFNPPTTLPDADQDVLASVLLKDGSIEVWEAHYEDGAWLTSNATLIQPPCEVVSWADKPEGVDLRATTGAGGVTTGAEPDSWRDAVLEQLEAWHIYVPAIHDHSPRLAIKALVNIETKAALDPAVSSQAAALALQAAPAVPDDVLEALRDALSVCSSVSVSRDRKIVREGCTLYAQTEEWCNWAENEVAPKIRAAIELAAAQSQEPVSERFVWMNNRWWKLHPKATVDADQINGLSVDPGETLMTLVEGQSGDSLKINTKGGQTVVAMVGQHHIEVSAPHKVSDGLFAALINTLTDQCGKPPTVFRSAQEPVTLTDRQFDLICQAIDKADTITMEGDYMLDSDDCIGVVRVMQALFSIAALREKEARK